MLKDAILRVLKQQRVYKTKKAFLNKLDSLRYKCGPNLIYPFVVGGYTFDAADQGIQANHEVALSVIFNYDKKKSETKQVAYILHQMEDVEKKGLIKGGMVIYLSSNLKEWQKGCLALDRNINYKGHEVKLENQYYEDWDSPYDNRETKVRYAIFTTPGAVLVL